MDSVEGQQLSSPTDRGLGQLSPKLAKQANLWTLFGPRTQSTKASRGPNLQLSGGRADSAREEGANGPPISLSSTSTRKPARTVPRIAKIVTHKESQSLRIEDEGCQVLVRRPFGWTESTEVATPMSKIRTGSSPPLFAAKKSWACSAESQQEVGRKLGV